VAFDRKLLHEHEELVLDLRPHWWFMAWPTLSLAASSILGLLLVAKGGDSTVWDGLKYLAVIGIVVSLVWFAYRYARWITTNFVVTSDRLIYRSGLISKQGIEIPLERVNTVFFNQGVFERMLGAGDLAIESGGETGKQNFKDIRRPSAVQNEIYKQMELNNTRMYGGAGHQPAAPAPPSASIPEQIAQLDALRAQGALSQAEFDAKKAELLGRM
jgi:membrane protein YdbS with pleckstrin-like domain